MFRKTNKMRRFRPTIETLEARRLLSTVWSDFDGDGFDDLALGASGEDSNAGAVHIIYGSATGLTTTGTQLWTQDSAGVLDTKEPGDQFGAALAGGDFDNDGRADLVIGVPGESIGAASQTGAVQILMGSATGLTATGNQFFHQDTNRVREINESDDRFGSALTTGHLNSDDFADFVVGTPGEDIGSVVDGGTINVFYGSVVGITPTGNQFFHLDIGGMNGVAAAGDEFGRALTAGDMNGDGRDDVAIGIPFADVDDAIGVANDAGAVTVMYGSASGLSSTGNQFWNEGTPGVSSTPFLDDEFGLAVASGDFNGDGRHDLAIGVPLEFVGLSSSGSMHVLYGSAAGITATGEQFFDQGDAGGNPEDSDAFGNSLTAADFSGDGRDDLIIGSPFETVGFLGPVDAGVVNVMFGSASGITLTGAFEITQESIGTGDSSEDLDHFGFTLGAGDFNGNGRADLVIGALDEDIGVTVLDTGRVWTLYGAPSGFSGGQSWGQDTPGIPDSSEANDAFGGGLDAGGGKSAPSGGRHDLARLITADFELDSLQTKANKRRFLSGRR